MTVFKSRTATVHVYMGDYHDRIQQLQRRIAEAAESVEGNVARMGSKPEHVRLAAEYDALVAEASEHRIELTLENLPRRISKALRRLHPPRLAGDPGVTEREARADAVMGVNEETFAEALVRGGTITLNGQEIAYRTIVAAHGPDGADLDLADDDFDAMSEGAFGVIYRKALDLNYGFVTDPKEISLASLLNQVNDKTSS